MNNTKRRFKRCHKWIFHLYCHASFILLFLAGFGIGLLPVVHAQAANNMLSPDGKDDYVSIPICPERAALNLNSFTVMGWIRFPDPITSKRDAATASWRLGGPKPPDTGQTMTPDFSAVLTIDIKKGGTNFWGLTVCDGSDCEGVVSPINDLSPGWHHLAASYDGNSGEIFLYRDGGEPVNSGTVLLGAPLPICHITLFRHVASLNVEGADEFALVEGVLSQDDINGTIACGLNSAMTKYADNDSINLIAYYPFDEFGDPDKQVVLDKSGNEPLYNAFRGSDTTAEKSDPAINNSNLTVAAVEDTDGDGVPNACDNCKDDKNPNQADRDNDGDGDVCDACPDEVNPADCGLVEGSGGSDGTFLNLNTTVSLDSDEKLNWLPPDCDITKITCYDTACLEGNNPPEDCALPATSRNKPIVLARVPDLYDNYAPGGDFRELDQSIVGSTYTENYQCDLLYVYEAAVLASASAIQCYACYENRAEDFNWNFATNNCELGIDKCIDPANHRIWTGESNCVLAYTGQFGVIEVHPTVNINNNGVTPVTIIGSANLDVSHIDDSSIWLSVNGANANRDNACAPEAKQISITDVNGDGINDKILKFSTPCIKNTMQVNVNTECFTLEATVKGVSFVGKDCTLNIIE